MSKQAQLNAQNFSNQIMLNCLAALENLAYFYGYQGSRIFDYYSGYAPRNNEKELVDAIIMQLEVFRASHSNYSSIYNNYDFPKNLTEEQIIKIVLDWEKFIPNADIKVFYDEIIFYLNGRSDTSGISGIIEQKRKEWGPTTEKQLSRIAKATPFINSRMHNEMERIKQSYQNGNYEIKANLYQNQNDDVEMADLNKNDQNAGELVLKFNEMEKKIESIFKVLQFRIIDDDKEWLKNNIKSFESYMKVINLGENEVSLKIFLYQQFKENIQKVFKDPREKNFFMGICDRIIACYNKSNASYQQYN
jgi:6-pyruvoyl-tetrahydropterin synthase